MLKRTVKACLARSGYEMHKLSHEPLALYQGYAQESLTTKRFYNVGAGLFFHRYWTNIDFASEWYRPRQGHPFVNFDLTSLEPLPIKDSSAEIIYSSHTIEHISDEAAAHLLSECRRSLVPGGIVRLTMPDFDLARRAFRRGDHFFFLSIGMSKSLPQCFLQFFASQLTLLSPARAPRKFSDAEIISMFDRGEPEELLNHLTSLCAFDPEFPASHINWWTYKKADRFLREAGFTTVYRSGYGQSAALPLRNTRLFDNTYPQMSMYVEAVV